MDEKLDHLLNLGVAILLGQAKVAIRLVAHALDRGMGRGPVHGDEEVLGPGQGWATADTNSSD
jgi:hypothetical protein